MSPFLRLSPFLRPFLRLWYYQPGVGNGPVIGSIVLPETYWTWTPGSDPTPFVQAQVVSANYVTGTNTLTVRYQTEGAMNVGTTVEVLVVGLDANGNPVAMGKRTKKIQKMWGYDDTVPFQPANALTPGNYQVVALILDSTGNQGPNDGYAQYWTSAPLPLAVAGG